MLNGLIQKSASALTLAFALISTSSFAANPPPEGETGTGFPNVADYEASGPFRTTDSLETSGCRIYRPTNLGENGLQHPVILWGNGTGATTSTYGRLLDHWASHGFIVAAATTSNAGTGSDMLNCLDYLEQANARSWGTYSGVVDVTRVGAAGHSQGGGGSIMAGQDPRIKVTAPFQPYTLGLGHRSSSQSRQNGPMFLMSGSADTIAGPILNQRPVFRNANVPVFWGTLRGATHFEPVGNAGGYRGPSTAWFRYHLMEDQHAREGFYGSNCTLCTSRSWDVERKGIN